MRLSGVGGMDCMPNAPNLGMMLAMRDVPALDMERGFLDMRLVPGANVPDNMRYGMGFSGGGTFGMVRGGLGGHGGQSSCEREQSTNNQGRDRETCVAHRYIPAFFAPDVSGGSSRFASVATQ